MGKVIAVANKKGGVAKTTTVLNVGSCLAEMGKKVLLIDIDSQGNLTKSIRIKEETDKPVKEEKVKTIYNAFTGEIDIVEAIYPTIQQDLYIVTANIEVANLEGQLANVDNKELFLKQLLSDITDYDYILIDCSPDLNLMTVNALVASNSLIIPLEPSIFGLDGLAQLINVIKLVQGKFNPELSVLGVLLTRVDSRSSLPKTFREQLKDIFGNKLFDTMIHQNINVVKSQIEGKPLSMYNRLARVYGEYRAIAQEVIRQNG